jgi:hypothetical protein
MITTTVKEDTATTAVDTVDTVDVDVDKLEKVYRDAVIEFKKDKTNKELRRARTAAKRVWDEAVLKKIKKTDKDAIQLNCKDCSQNFLFTKEEQEYYKDPERNWNHKPLRCRSCAELQKGRRRYNNEIDNANEDGTKKSLSSEELKGKGRNMCYEFQRKGECKYGNECKFNHDPNFAGKKRKHDDEDDNNDDDGNNVNDDGNKGNGAVKVLSVDDDDDNNNNNNNNKEGDDKKEKEKDDDVPTLIPTCKWGKNCTLKRCRFNHDDVCVTATTATSVDVPAATSKDDVDDDDDDNNSTGTSDKKKKKKKKDKKKKKAKKED